MYSIHVVSTIPQAVFAAEELKKYLRMMMPRAGDIPVSIDPGTADGFRLGLMADFGLDMSDAKDPSLDDIIYVDTDEQGGIIAGSNPIALLIAVYRYLRECGCRWLFPGVDGEWIPTITALTAVSYRKMADHRYRGQCNEGAEYQTDMIETIDFTPKIGMNTYMLEFDIPSFYYNSYYNHGSSFHRRPEPITNETILQWKRQCEAEIQKRGLHFHDMGHGWTAEPFGLDSKLTFKPGEIPAEKLTRVAEIKGVRELFGGRPINTNFCMSSAENRNIVAQYVADYAQTQNNVDFLHIWLADATNNHCECDECRKKTVPDWYVMLLNDIDAELTKRGLATHLVFIVYTETFWAPVTERLHNPSRFTMLYAPISRKYTETYAETPDESAVTPFCLNNNIRPHGMAECLGYLKAWQKVWDGDCFCYEYHFWRHEYMDPSGLSLARLLYDDICALRKNGLHGIVEDGSQRSYFPNGFPFYVYGETLFDKSRSFEELQEDYFSHAYGENWKTALDYLTKIRDHVSFTYLESIDHQNLNGKSPAELKQIVCRQEIADNAAKVPQINAAFKAVLEQNIIQPKRPASVMWQLLEHFLDYAAGVAAFVERKAVGDHEGAYVRIKALFRDFSAREIAIERWYDQSLANYSLSRVYDYKKLFPVSDD